MEDNVGTAFIAEKFSTLEAAKANDLLERGQVSRNIVLLAPELL